DPRRPALPARGLGAHGFPVLLGGVEGGADGRASPGLRHRRVPRDPARAARERGRPVGHIQLPPILAAAVPAARAAPLHRFGRGVAGRDRRGLRLGPAHPAAGVGGGPALLGLPHGLPERVVRPERLPQRGPLGGGDAPLGESAGARRDLPRLPRLQAAARAGGAAGARRRGPLARLRGRHGHRAGPRRRGDGGAGRRCLAGVPRQPRRLEPLARSRPPRGRPGHGERLLRRPGGERPRRLGLRRARGGRGLRLRPDGRGAAPASRRPGRRGADRRGHPLGHALSVPLRPGHPRRPARLAAGRGPANRLPAVGAGRVRGAAGVAGPGVLGRPGLGGAARADRVSGRLRRGAAAGPRAGRRRGLAGAAPWRIGAGRLGAAGI
ncbi:MAG: hypothetical protein AVDCRST_MAG04-150, partial [uncultured Acetobacteraceae bacterium]